MIHFRKIRALFLGACVFASAAWAGPESASAGAATGLDRRVKIAAGSGGAADFRARSAAIRSLTASLGASDAEALFEAIVAPVEAVDLPPREWAALHNDALNLLGALDEPLPAYTDRLLRLLAQEARDEVLRDYALQHLLSFAERRVGPAARPELLAAAERLAFEAPRSTLPGTYLLGAYHMAGVRGHPGGERLRELAYATAADPEAFVPNRISAVQVCARLGHGAVLPLSARLARDESLPTALRVACVSAIGQLGDAGHLLLLKKIKYSEAGDFRLHRAADAAIRNLKR